MSFFQQVEGEAAILVERGVYKQVDLYVRDGYLYAKVSGGFVRLTKDGSTSKAHMRLVHMSWNGALYSDALGRLSSIAPIKGERIDDGEVGQRLLGKGGLE